MSPYTWSTFLVSVVGVMIHPSFPFIFNPSLLTCSLSTPRLMQILANPRGSSSQLCQGLDLCDAGINLWIIGVGRSSASTGNLGNWEERLSARVIAVSGHRVICWRRWRAWHSNLTPLSSAPASLTQHGPYPCSLPLRAWHSMVHTLSFAPTSLI